MISEPAQEIRELKRRNRQLEQTIEVLKAATRFCLGERPARPVICQFIDAHRDRFGITIICRMLTAAQPREADLEPAWGYRLIS